MVFQVAGGQNGHKRTDSRNLQGESSQPDDELSSDEEEEMMSSARGGAYATNQPDSCVIKQQFKRSTQMEEISTKILNVSNSSKPLIVKFLAGSIHGNLEGNLKVV